MKTKLDGLLTEMNCLLFLSILLFAGPALSRPIVGDMAVVNDGAYGNTYGGEFNITTTGSSYLDFVGFCLEINEPIDRDGGTYDIYSVGNFAELGGVDGLSHAFKDELSAASQWVYWNYLFENTFQADGFGARSDYLANEVQYTLWLLEGETGTSDFDDITYRNNSIFWKTYFESYYVSDDLNNSFFAITGDVYVLNLWGTFVDTSGNSQTGHIQSIVVGEPIPEPTTILLFSTGLIGLAGFARKRKKK